MFSYLFIHLCFTYPHFNFLYFFLFFRNSRMLYHKLQVCARNTVVVLVVVFIYISYKKI